MGNDGLIYTVIWQGDTKLHGHPGYYDVLNEKARKNSMTGWMLVHGLSEEEAPTWIRLDTVDCFFLSTPASREAYARIAKQAEDENEDDDKPWLRG